MLAARAIADTAILRLEPRRSPSRSAFAVGFRLHGTALDGPGRVRARASLFGFAFEWVFIALGLFAGNAQAAQGMGMIVFPFAFISSAYVPVDSMPGWLQVFAEHQPLTYMVDAVRALTLGPQAQALLGHPASYFVVRALLWAAGDHRRRAAAGGREVPPRLVGPLATFRPTSAAAGLSGATSREDPLAPALEQLVVARPRAPGAPACRP